MPNKWTFEMLPVQDLLRQYKVGSGWADPFCGNSTWCQFQNDLSSGVDAFEFMKSWPDNCFKGVLFDPPYSMEQVKRSYQSVGIKDWQTRYGNNKNGGFPNVKDEIARTVEKNGIVISFGWNSNGLGAKRNFQMEDVLLIAHGGNRHDTIITIEKKS